MLAAVNAFSHAEYNVPYVQELMSLSLQFYKWFVSSLQSCTNYEALSISGICLSSILNRI